MQANSPTYDRTTINVWEGVEQRRDWARSATVPAFMNLFIETDGAAGIYFGYDRN